MTLAAKFSTRTAKTSPRAAYLIFKCVTSIGQSSEFTCAASAQVKRLNTEWGVMRRTGLGQMSPEPWSKQPTSCPWICRDIGSWPLSLCCGAQSFPLFLSNSVPLDSKIKIVALVPSCLGNAGGSSRLPVPNSERLGQDFTSSSVGFTGLLFCF